MDSLRDAVALVTGASRGIGTFICRTLAREGATVVAVARDREGLLRTCDAIEKAGGTAHAIDCDLSDPSQWIGMIERAQVRAGAIDVLVNNAGVEWHRRYGDYTAEQLRTSITVNLHAPMELARILLPRMQARGRGHIVNIASLAGRKGLLFNAPYSATKAGLILWTDALRQELRQSPVGASVILPGYIDEAGMFADDGVKPPRLLGLSSPQAVADAVVKAIRERTPEIIVAPGPMRPLLAIAQLSPRLADRAAEWIGIHRMNEARRRDPG